MIFVKSKIISLKIVLFVFVILLQSELLSKNITIDGTAIFSEPASFGYSDFKNKKTITLKADEFAKPVKISESEANKVFTTYNEKIVINNYPISLQEKGTVELIQTTPAVRLGTNWSVITIGGERQLKSFEPAFYTGKIKDEKTSKVTVFYLNGELYSIIEREGHDNYSITPVVGETSKNAHILTSQNTSLLGKDYNPFLDVHLDEEETDLEQIELIRKFSEQTLSTEFLQADIIIEATHDFYKLFNDVDKITAYIGAVMSHTSQIFESNVYIQLFVPQVVIHQDKATDPYGTTTQIYERLYQLRELWRKKTVKRAIVCLMTDIDYQGGSGGYRVGGVSLGLGTLCKDNQGYCVFGMQGHYKYPTSNYTWDVSVSAHELGHAFGSPHTHNCYFQPNMIDTCITRDKPQQDSDGCVTTGNPIPRPGTLMSYCHLTNPTRTVGLYFHERVKPIIRGFAEQATCVKSATEPTLLLLNPNGGAVLFPGDEIKIKWASSQVEFVGIRYSLDDGLSWKWIEKYAEAINGSITWIVPDTITGNLRIFIQDSYNSYVNDETKTALTIDKPIFNIQTPNESERIGYDVKYKIKWEQKYLDNFTIELNTDADKIGTGEETWTTIASGLTGFSYDWEVPDIEKENCQIRISGTMESGNEFVEYSGKFAIGKPSFKILKPTAYDRLCAGQNFEITWESDFIAGMYVQFTTDNGDKWKHLRFSPINGFEGSYKWSVPSNYSENCILRFSNFESRNIVYAVSNQPFSIDSCETNIDEFGNKIKDSAIEILSLVPNPAKSSITLTFNNKLMLQTALDIVIINESGTVVETYRFSNTPLGLNSVILDINKLSQGNYYLNLQSEQENTGAALKILR